MHDLTPLGRDAPATFGGIQVPRTTKLALKCGESIRAVFHGSYL